jgi:cell pole-organizing protein PopZ
MTQPAKAQEPSMEEILASIRRIISDDDTAAKAAAAVPPKAVVPPAPPPRAEVPVRPAPVPQKPVSPVLRTPAAIQSDIEAVLAEPEKPVIEQPKVAGNGAAELADPDILELTEEMAAVEPPEPEPDMRASNFRTIDGQPDVFFAETPEPEAEPEPEDEPAFAMPSEPAPPPPSFGYDNLHSSSIISQATSAAVDSAFNQLAQSVFTQNGRTIEDLVRDMLRPMLKSWLDDNLPGLVERLVRAEIERVSRGR